MVTVQIDSGQVVSYQVANRAEWLVCNYTLEKTKNLVQDRNKLWEKIDKDNRHFRIVPDKIAAAKGALSRTAMNLAMYNYLIKEYGDD